MTAIDTIENVLRAKLLKASLIFIPQHGATEQALDALSKVLPRSLSKTHLSLLKRWNGVNLDVVRIYGATSTPNELRGLADVQNEPFSQIPGAIVFGDDPSGFVYAESLDGKIMSLDLSSGEIETIANNMNDFFSSFVFGPKAAEFAGDAWLSKLKKVGLI